MERVLSVQTDPLVGTGQQAVGGAATAQPVRGFFGYVFDNQRRILLTKRSRSKPNWPGAWSNSCSGYLGPGETEMSDIERCLELTLGVASASIDLVISSFRYRAPVLTGRVENGVYLVYRIRCEGRLVPNPDEVASIRWVDWEEFVSVVLAGHSTLTPWCRPQVVELDRLGMDPFEWPVSSLERPVDQ